jgi:hypothetical protein
VAAGLAEHLRVPAVLVRIVFIGLLVANGLGALLYVAVLGGASGQAPADGYLSHPHVHAGRGRCRGSDWARSRLV